MINPGSGDVGREVVYARLDSHRRTERGVITSFNARFVFVRYAGMPHGGVPTEREDLEWGDDGSAPG